MEQEKIHNVEEFHRGEWQPLMVKQVGTKEKVQKHVMITEEEAEVMNIYAKERKTRYVLAEEKEKKPELTEEEKEQLKSLRAEYKAVFGKSAFPGWNAEILKEKIKEGAKINSSK